MLADYVLQRHPDRVLPWLRARLGLSRAALAQRLGTEAKVVARWEAGRARISLRYHRPLVRLLAPHLATEEGVAFVESIGRGESLEG